MDGGPVRTALDAGREAFERGDFEAARSHFEDACVARTDAEALDGLGQSLWFLCEIDAGIAHRERAYAAYLERDDVARAASIALWLAVEQATSLGNAAASSGWFRRAERLLSGVPLCPAHAELEVHRGLGCPDPEEALLHFQRAVAIGRRLGDRDGEVRGLNQVGFIKVVLGELDEGFALLDESMAAATSGELRDPWAIGATCCSLLFACERMSDLRRAGEWCRIVFDLTRRRRFVPLSALCRSIFAGVLIAQGDWQRAEAELFTALDVYRGVGKPLAAYPLARLAGLRMLQGRVEEAEQLISGWEGHPEMGAVSVALLLERDDLALAEARLAHQLERVEDDSPFAAELLPLLVRLRLAQGDVDAARSAAESFARLARRLGHEHLAALADLAGAQVAVAAGDGGQTSSLGFAVERFARLGMVYDEGRAHLELARAVAEALPELAVAEARAALGIFEGLGAGSQSDRAASLLRSLGAAGRSAPKRPGELSIREREVLGLLEHGLSNREIAERLYISPKTASHHVSQILAKLDVRSRAEAAAYSARERASGSGPE